MNRQELIDALMWNTGGWGFGICAVASAALWASREPLTKAGDLRSVVAVMGPPEQYTDDELAKLVAFSEERTKKYDEMFDVRMGCNLTLIGKAAYSGDNPRWLRKRLTWNAGPMYSDSLDDALEVMRR